MLESLCDAVMRAVARSGAVDESNMTRAVGVMRAEIKALVAGEEYANERAAVLAGTVPESAVVASVVASCVLKLRAPI